MSVSAGRTVTANGKGKVFPNTHGGSAIMASPKGEIVPTGATGAVGPIDHRERLIAHRVLNFFHIYPLSDNKAIEDDNVGDHPGSNNIALHRVVQAQAVVAHTLRLLKQRKTEPYMIKWFGDEVYNTPALRNEVVRVVNGVSNILDHTELHIGGSRCTLSSGSVMAYVSHVYDASTGKDLTLTATNLWPIYLCEPWLVATAAHQIGALIHEASHLVGTHDHPLGYYGPDSCQALARSNSSQAVRTADNFNYFITDLLHMSSA